ncbi:MAG: hypothetical protein Q8K86_07255 [Candidatus Nanopelagicaceae bacterium]|nr:hypothetical protein [Candidatus Nanopelagicaceae bacterium]
MAEEEKKTTKAGPHGGGNKFNQMKVKNDFIVVKNEYSGKYGRKADDSVAPRKKDLT